MFLSLLLLATACGGSDDSVDATATTASEEAATQDEAVQDEVVQDDAQQEDVVQDDTAEAPADEPEASTSDDSDHDHDDADHDDHDHDDEEAGDTMTAPSSGVDVALFFDGALAEAATTEPCTLADGTETTCYRISVAGDPVTYDAGPFCPTNISDGPEAGGIWFDGTGVYELDGEFFANVAELYGDDNWLMYNEDGSINVTETAEEFDLAARPNVDPSLQNHCVEGRAEWLDNGVAVASTVLIPAEPVFAGTASTTNGNLGVTLDGIVIAQSAPVDAILAAYTIAAFDDCGGHYNPVDGYHLHGAVGCSELERVADGETPMFAYAMDGFPVHSPLADDTEVELDACNGHETEEAGYHYHANGAEENLVIECFMGTAVAGAEGDAGGRPPRPDGPPPGDDG